MEETVERKQLLLKYQILLARLEIREFFLKAVVKDVYENIGQTLSLVRMQLVFIDGKTKGRKTKDFAQCGALVGQSIRDLRNMCKNFYPDQDLQKEGGFIEGLENTLKILKLLNKHPIKVKGVPNNTLPELKLIAFKIVLGILIEIEEKGWAYKKIIVSYEEKVTGFTIEYMGEVLDLNSKNTDSTDVIKLSLKETVYLVNGSIYGKTRKTGITVILLKIPLIILL